MGISSKRSGSWSTPASGSIRVKSGGSWRTAVSVRVKQNGAWVNSGYVGYPNAATGFTGGGGNGDNRQVTFYWAAPSGGATPTGYRLYIYDSNNNQYGSPVDVGNVTSYTHTFASANSTWYVRLKTLGAAGESLTFATNTAGGTRLGVNIGNIGYYVPYPIYGWSGDNTFTPAYWSESTWPGKPFGDYTYHGSKAFDGNYGTYWTGQSWAWPGGSDWVGFYLSGGFTPHRYTSLVSWPAGNACGVFWFDYWDGANFGFTGYSWPNNGGWAFGGQFISTDFQINPGVTGAYRFNYSELGYNPTAYGTYRVLTAEISGTYQYIVQTGTGYTYTPPTNNAVYNA